jgi:hypothetical protein
MNANDILIDFTIPTPCPMDWDRMRGDDRVRYCEGCDKHVYDLTAMRPDERNSLISIVRSQGEELCGRLYQRPDGTLVASECPPAPRAAAGAWPSAIGWFASIIAGCRPAPRTAANPGQITIRWLMSVIAGCAAILGFTRVLISTEPPPKPPVKNVTPRVMGALIRHRPAPANGPGCSSPAPTTPSARG